MPIRLFGETDAERALRLYKIEEKEAAEKEQEEKNEFGQDEFGILKKQLETEDATPSKEETEVTNIKQKEGSSFNSTKENYILQALTVFLNSQVLSVFIIF